MAVFPNLSSCYFCVLLVCVSLVDSRDVALITQTNISAEFLTDPNLNLPFTSFLYISAGQNATESPPTTVRMAQFQDGNSTTGWAPPTVLVIEHTTNFTIPEAINAPNGVAWHSSYMGQYNESLQHGPWTGENNQSVEDTSQLMRTWGTGIVADLWELIAEEYDKQYVMKYEPGKVDENILNKRILDKMGLGDGENARTFSKQISQTSSSFSGDVMPEFSDASSGTVTGTKIKMINSELGEIYDFDFSRPKTIGTAVGDVKGFENIKYSGATVSDPLKLPMRPAYPLMRNSLQPTDDKASWRGSQAIVVEERASSAPPCLRNLESRQCGKSVPTKSEVTMVRQKGVYSTISLVSKRTALGLNLAVIGAAITYVIIDFIDGRYIGGAMGAVGVIVGSGTPMLPIWEAMDVATSAAIFGAEEAAVIGTAGPMGVLLGTALAILFFILPGVFQMLPELPSINNNTEIIQYTFFGDKDHTGNEKCQKEHPGCIASYGPGIFNLTLEWEYVDAIFFMIWANKGLPITIPDAAMAFQHAISLDKNKSSTAVAQITCGNYVGSHRVTDRWGNPAWSGLNPNKCNTPKFHLNRDLIMLPNINRTAASVYNDIIGSPGANGGGSCKIIDHADNPVTIPNYGIVIKGLPVAITCGINVTAPAEENTDAEAPAEVLNATASAGTAVTRKPPSPTDFLSRAGSVGTSSPGILTGLPPGSSPGNLSTDGRSGEGYTPPPPPSPFQNSLTPQNSGCFTASNFPNYFCLPNGTYDRQGGTFDFESERSTGLYFPAGSGVVLRYSLRSLHGIQQKSTESTTNLTTRSLALKDVKTFDLFIPPSSTPLPPLACLFTEVDYHGDVTCVGVGGGNMTSGASKVASVGIYGGATVTLYPKGYGDPGSQTFTVSVPDLATVPYGVNEALKGMVMAVLVQGENEDGRAVAVA